MSALYCNNNSYIYLLLKSMANIIGAGAGQVRSPFGFALFYNSIFIAFTLLAPAAQLIGLP